MTAREMLEEFERLSTAERIHLVQDMWDRIAATPGNLPALTDAQERELRDRMASYAANPDQTVPAEEVFARLQKRGGDSRRPARCRARHGHGDERESSRHEAPW